MTMKPHMHHQHNMISAANRNTLQIIIDLPSYYIFSTVSIWVLWWTKQRLGRFFSGFLLVSLPQISFHYFSKLISFILFYLISPASVMMRQVWSKTLKKGASSHLIPWPDHVSDMSWGYLFIFYSTCNKNPRICMYHIGLHSQYWKCSPFTAKCI